MIQDDELLQEFVVESLEHLADVESQLLQIEERGQNVDVSLVNTVFRAVHSVKGAAGFLGLSTINVLAHNLENVLNLVRNSELIPNREIIDVLLRAADTLRNLVADIANSNGFDIESHVVALQQVAAQTEESSPLSQRTSPSIAALSALPKNDATQSSDGEVEVAHQVVEVVSDMASSLTRETSPNVSFPLSTSDAVATASEPRQPNDQESSRVADGARNATKPAESNVRVNVSILDKLMNLAGELVLGRNQLLRSVSTSGVEHLEAIASRLDHVTSELQEAIMQTRMQPVGTVFNRFPRVVRDLSSKLGKRCELEIEGSEVEVDKTIVEAIVDPLTHLVRNSVDHGIELPAQRRSAGKPEQGTIRLRAFHRAGKVCIRIEDDGNGIDANRIKAKALQNGLITEHDAASMSTNDALRLIFAPGFSTAAAITDISGRGVGMDVVRTNIERIGGTVEIESELGVGSAMHITLPLTLAIIPSMIVGCSADKFAIPQANIAELVRVPESEMTGRIGNVQGSEVLRLRGALLPLIRLDQVLGLRSTESSDSNRQVKRGLNIVVVESGQYRYGVAVDALFDSEEIVVKPLGKQLKELTYLAGATILGDGRVALILDITGIAMKANIRSSDEAAKELAAKTRNDNGEVHRLLLYDNAPGEQFAIPMACVSRIERSNVEDILHIGGQAMLTYLGGTLPLLAVEDYINAKPRNADLSHITIVVFKAGQREIGLIAPHLKDICNVELEVDTGQLREPGVAGVIVIDGLPTRLLDVVELTKKSNPQWIVQEERPSTKSDSSYHILLAEDSSFFRRHVEETLTDEGYTVTTAVDGRDAWEQLQAMAELPTVVVTDVEMPNMTGLEFCQEIRRNARTKELPVIALTSLAGTDDIAKGKAVGVDEYQIKLDRSNLLEAVARLCVAR